MQSLVSMQIYAYLLAIYCLYSVLYCIISVKFFIYIVQNYKSTHCNERRAIMSTQTISTIILVVILIGIFTAASILIKKNGKK